MISDIAITYFSFSSMKWMISNESLNYIVFSKSHSNSTIHLKSFISSMSSLFFFVNTMNYCSIGTETIGYCSNKDPFSYDPFYQPVGWLSL